MGEGGKPPERRMGRDRRQRDVDAAEGQHERRRGIEPRMPEVAELPMTDSQWQAFAPTIPGTSP